MAKLTTVSIYPEDLAWLQRRQLQVSAERSAQAPEGGKTWLTMPDLMHEFVQALQAAEAAAGA
jgi:hypothetical protein